MDDSLLVYAVRTDLAMEARQQAETVHGGALPGVISEQEEDGEISITRIDVTTEEGAQALGKQIGRYVTIEAPGLRHKNSNLQDEVAARLALEFAHFMSKMGLDRQAKVLVIGLGNWHVTPDALGPLVVENMMVTRHYFQLMPDQVSPGYREVSAIAPGVLGTTGIESSEIVQGVVDKAKPDLVIAIDALASKALERVNTTIQIANTGIHPGSGIGNKRKGLTAETLGVPVIAIGVPTVVYASTIVSSCIEMIVNHFKQQKADTGQIFGLLDQLPEAERLQLAKEVLDPIGHDLLVTPKEIDQFVEDIANVIASGLNAALHEAVNQDNVGAYTH